MRKQTRAKPPFTLTGPAVSALVHGTLVALVMFLGGPTIASPVDDALVSSTFLYPILHPTPTPRPVQEQLSYVGLSGLAMPTTAAPVVETPTAARELKVTEPLTQVTAPEVHAEEAPKAFTEFEVDSAAARDPESVGPAYPPTLLASRIEGIAIMQFVVDSTGHVDLATLKVIDSTNPLFTRAVRDALPKMKFRPAWLSGQTVPQLVEQSFAFRIKPPKTP